MKLFVTYISHYGLNGLPFRCCSEHSDLYSFLDWLKQRALNDQRTHVIDWHYQTSVHYIAGGGNVPPKYRTPTGKDWWDPCSTS